MKDNHGQVLITFILCIPVIITLLLIGIDLFLINLYKTRIYNITEQIIDKEIDTDNSNDIIKLYDEYKVKYEDIDVNIEDKIVIKLKMKVKTILHGNELNIIVKAYKDGNNIIYEKG